VIEDGITSLTTMVMMNESDPPVLVAVIVYCVDGETTLGVPERVPVAESRRIPDGSEGDTEYDTTVPPVDDGDSVNIAVPLVKV
jgi:hypothetical protein